MDVTRFHEDLALVPHHLESLAGALEAGLPGVDLLPAASRVLVLGMGSSAYAAGLVAQAARAQGVAVEVSLASAELLPPPAPDLVVIAVSATGGSAEVLHAVTRYAGTGRLVAVTNKTDSPLAEVADVLVPLTAGVEASGVACRTFRHTVVVLSEVLRTYGFTPTVAPAVSARRAAGANAELLEGAPAWLPQVSSTLLGPHGTFLLAPLERLASAQQGALMMREVPRRPAWASETGDWAHVDLYLARTLDYRVLLFAGSRWDGQALDWLEHRGATFVSVGADLPGAAHVVRYAGDEDPLLAVLSEVLVAELVAARWHEADPDFTWSGR
ncbi:SIS domain-containing protein [Pseudactinotalea sp. Z1732]|uniref:SIS domain-containing protein n=1 Tax=Micrococcales TaxID=85006 RepID=UPI003C7BEBE8